MARRPAPLLHREDPTKEPLVGNIKVTRADWINVARDVLISEGIAEVKILPLGQRLGVSRSSFYWYFQSRKDLLDALLEDWAAKNTSTLVEHCALPSSSITAAVCNFFRCFVDPDLFDQRLDFAVRDWSRRDGQVQRVIDRADRQRLEAIVEMFDRHGYDPGEAEVRARILYFMQLGYHALDQSEPMAERMALLEGYLYGFTGERPSSEECAAFRVYAERRGTT